MKVGCGLFLPSPLPRRAIARLTDAKLKKNVLNTKIPAKSIVVINFK